MAQSEPGHEPGFALPRYDVIHEDNWAVYQARGFKPLSNDDVDWAQTMYGTANVYTGDKYDDEAQRPLRHKPGVSVYVSPEGIEYRRVQNAEWETWRREHGISENNHASDDPAAN